MRLRALAALALALPLVGAGPSIPGLRASGTVQIQANLQGQPINVGGNVALYHKGTLYRLDLLSLGFPGTSNDLSALASQLLGPGGVTVVYDGATSSLTVWSSSVRAYYVGAAPRAPAPPPSPATVAAASGGDPLSALAGVAVALHDVQSATIQLTGHSIVNGHPTTGLDVQMRRQLPGRAPESYHAQLALADDLSGFPVQLTLESVPPSPAAVGGSMKLDLTSVRADTPDDAMFRVPAGYVRVNTLTSVLGRGLP
ncbi:MAG TPA: hypothetical protein VHT05_07410 [Candidatus Elarobacter sp.]|jgi:hypothetical protein|nr:hypothetical protein [Candidatus Elarobacter sp.]